MGGSAGSEAPMAEQVEPEQGAPPAEETLPGMELMEPETAPPPMGEMVPEMELEEVAPPPEETATAAPAHRPPRRRKRKKLPPSETAPEPATRPEDDLAAPSDLTGGVGRDSPDRGRSVAGCSSRPLGSSAADGCGRAAAVGVSQVLWQVPEFTPQSLVEEVISGLWKRPLRCHSRPTRKDSSEARLESGSFDVDFAPSAA